MMEDYFKRRDFVSLPVYIARLWHWDDNTKMSQWLELGFNRLIEYGMHVPILTTDWLKKEDYKKAEDELTDYFIEEMSKRPKVPHT